METPTVNSTISTQDERVMAALAHVSAILPMMGVIAPIVVWLTQREKSRFVAFQALQAIVFQLLMILIYFIGFGCYMGTFFSLFAGAALSTGNNSGHAPLNAGFFLPFVVMGGMFLAEFIMIIYGLIGAILTFQGKNFRYALIGDWVARRQAA